MEYTRSEYIGDRSIDETFKGESDEIIKLMVSLEFENSMSDIEKLLDDKTPTVNTDEMVSFIYGMLKDNRLIKEIALDVAPDYLKDLIEMILDLELEYLESIGIAGD